MRFSGVDSRSSFMGPENIDRKTYPHKVGQNSQNSLIIVRSQWDLIGSPRADRYQPFRQCASHGHLPHVHEGNSENVFSMAKSWSTCNTQPSMLRLLTETAANKKLHKPDVADIWRWCQAKYKGMRTRVYVDGESSFDSESGSSDSSCDE